MRSFLRGLGITIGIGAGVLLFLIYAAVQLGMWPQGSPADPSRGDRFSAWVACKTELEQRLKAPSTAEWASYNDAKVVKQANGRWAVGSEVTAQNSFGVPLRQQWACDVSITGDRYTVHFLTLDEQVLIGR